MSKVPRFVLTDHVCRRCNGRMLQQVNSGITAGGNSVYICASCEYGSAAICVSRFCHCADEPSGAKYGQKCRELIEVRKRLSGVQS